MLKLLSEPSSQYGGSLSCPALLSINTSSHSCVEVESLPNGVLSSAMALFYNDRQYLFFQQFEPEITKNSDTVVADS